ncbi:MAG: hypothetical protein GY799_00490 [Desulfobulbaceae bacterium]|nr:hypothetical protein [Desulfobulbaceae bacterium]
MKKNDSILFSLLESGKIDKDEELKIVVQLHKSGIIDVVKLITEAIADFKNILDKGTDKTARLEKVRSAIEYLKIAEAVITAEEESPVLESVAPVDEPRATSIATVIGR